MSSLRDELLAQLTAYRPIDTCEREMALETLRFVQANAACSSRDFAPGHVTASSWILSPALDEVVLVHHAKLQRWLQPGGHLEPSDGSCQAAALREATEETGLRALAPLGGIFDVDVHEIPSRGSEAAHLHYDVRYAFVASAAEPLLLSEESREIAWFTLAEAQAAAGAHASIRRMVQKSAVLRVDRLAPVKGAK